MPKKFSKKYEINYYDVDYKLQCKLPSIVNYLCDIGNNQSEVLGETIEALTEKKMAWVFYQYDINIIEYPKYRDVITIETEGIGFNRFYAYRKYTIYNEEGKVLVNALALFFLINIEKRRPMRVSDEQIKVYGAEGLDKVKIDMGKIDSIEREDNIKDFNIRYSDIDSNGHVNNAKYFEWAIESVPVDVIKDYKIERVRVIFEKETTYGNNIKAKVEIKEEKPHLITNHLIENGDGEELTKLEITWSRE